MHSVYFHLFCFLKIWINSADFSTLVLPLKIQQILRVQTYLEIVLDVFKICFFFTLGNLIIEFVYFLSKPFHNTMMFYAILPH